MSSSWPPLLLLEAELTTVDGSLVSHPDDINLLFRRAGILAGLGQLPEAQAAYLKVLSLAPAHFGALNDLGALLVSMGHVAAAQVAFEEAVKRHPENPKGHVNLANILFQKGDSAAALEHFRAALQNDSEYKPAHQGMAYALMELGDESGARMHKAKGFERNHTLTVPYRGSGVPIPIVMLASCMGGMIPLRPHLDDRIFHTTVVYVEFYDPQTPLPLHRLILNAVGDADLCRADCDAAAVLLRQTSMPVINAPEAVRSTGRMNNAKRFASIPGVIAPKILTLPRKEITVATLAKNGFTFPLLLRAPGFNTGYHFERVDNPEALQAALMQLPGDELLVIEYLDARGADGKVRKYRVMIIDGKLYPLHVAISPHWKVHYFSADMKDNPEHRAEEDYFLNHMEEVVGKRAMVALAAICDELALDYGGIDFGLSRNGDVLFFEANATMAVYQPPPDAIWDYRRKPTQHIFDAVRTMLIGRASGVTKN